MEMIALERAIMTKLKPAGLAFAIAIALPGAAQAETLKVLTAGAFKQVLLAVIPQFQAAGHDIGGKTARSATSPNASKRARPSIW